MERYLKFIKSKGKLYVILMLLLICIVIFSFYKHVQSKEVDETANILHSTVIDNMKFIREMFPEHTFTRQGKYYNAGERENYYIESIIPGAYVNIGQDELLVVVRRRSDELSHVGGFYNVYMAVFDNTNGELISTVKLFSADDGNYRIFDSQKLSYIFFAGNTTYQGWTNWYGGLWQAGTEWKVKWPYGEENQQYYDYWENRAVYIGTDYLTILQRNVLPLTNEDQLIPDYTWEFSEKLLWDEQSGSYIKLE